MRPSPEQLITRLERLVAKGETVGRTRRNISSNVITADVLEFAPFAEWRSQSSSLLSGVLGTDHVYAKSFDRDVRSPSPSSVNLGVGTLRADLEDARLGLLADLRSLLEAEVFADFLEMAQHLLQAGYHVPSASLGGAVLEDGLRRIARNHDVRVKSRDDGASLNARLAEAGIYSRLEQKRVQTAIDVRNLADHGRFDDFAAQDVRLMLATVESFLAANLGESPARLVGTEQDDE